MTVADRRARLAGMAFVFLLVVTIVVSPDVGNPGDSAGHLTTLLQAHPLGVQVFSWIAGLQVFLLLIFAAGLRERLSAAGEPLLGRLSFAGAVLVTGLACAQHACVSALDYLVQAGHPDAGALTTLNTLSYGLETVLRFPMALLVGAASLALVRSAAGSTWVGYLGLGEAALSLVAAGSTRTDGPFAVNGAVAVPSLLLLLVWVLAVSLNGRRRARAAGLAVPATA